MTYRKALRYAMHGCKIAASCLAVYFMFTKDDEAEHIGYASEEDLKRDMDELDELEREEISIQN